MMVNVFSIRIAQELREGKVDKSTQARPLGRGVISFIIHSSLAKDRKNSIEYFRFQCSNLVRDNEN